MDPCLDEGGKRRSWYLFFMVVSTYIKYINTTKTEMMDKISLCTFFFAAFFSQKKGALAFLKALWPHMTY